MPNDSQAEAELDMAQTGDAADNGTASHDPAQGATDLSAYRRKVEEIQNSPGEIPASEDEPPRDDAQEGNGEEEVEEEKGENDSDDSPPRPTRFRMRARDEVEAEAFSLKKRFPDWSLSKCEEKAKAILGIETETGGTQEQGNDPVETVESCRAKLKELIAEKAQAIDDVEFSTASKLDLEIEELRDRIQDLRISEERAKAIQESRQMSEFEESANRSKSLAVQVYPDCTKDDSPLVQKMIEINQALEANEDPLFYSPNKPFKLAQMAAAELGIAPKATVNVSKAKTVAQTNGSRRPMQQPASGSARTTTATTHTRLEKAMASVKTMSDYEDVVAQLTT